MNELERTLAPMRAEPEFELSARAHERIVGRLQAQVRALPELRRRAWRRRVLAGAGVAAMAAMLALVLLTRRPQVQLATHGVGVVWMDPQLSVPAGAEADLMISGVRIHADAETRLQVERGERVVLEHGAVHCQVPKLGPKRSFVVVAGPTQIIVHGTEFSVSYRDAAQPCVEVLEGRVEVKSAASLMLTSGQRWQCGEPLPPVPAAAPSTLAEENGLLSRALQAERERNTRRARQLFRELLRRYPDSPLAPEARAGARRVSEH